MDYVTPYQPYGYGSGLEELLLSGQIGNGFNSTHDAIHTASVNNIKETSDAARDTVDAVRDAIDASKPLLQVSLEVFVSWRVMVSD